MLPTIAQLVSKYGVQPLKKYGQNFIYDESLCDKIVKYADINPTSNVLEVGPGPAGLTRSILKSDPNSCTIIEMDRRFMPLLDEIRAYYPKLSIKQGDALRFKLAELTNQPIATKVIGGVCEVANYSPLSKCVTEERVQGRNTHTAHENLGPGLTNPLSAVVELSKQTNEDHSLPLPLKLQRSDKKLSIISNLPYNIGCKLLTNWLEEIDLVNSITVMLQKEVVERIIAKPACKDYGRLSIICQILCDVQKCFEVSSKVFYPPPQVDSAVVKLVPKEIKLSTDIIKQIQIITMHAFNGRRKTLKKSLQAVPNHLTILEQLGIDPTLRPENLSPVDYYNIANLTLK